MARKHKVDEINLEITNLLPFANDTYVGFTIDWTSNIGFGQYTIYKKLDSDEWLCDSECMDINEDKDFIKELMKIFIGKLNVIS